MGLGELFLGKVAAPAVKWLAKKGWGRAKKRMQLDAAVRSAALKAANASPAHASSLASEAFITVDLVPRARRGAKLADLGFTVSVFVDLYRARFGRVRSSHSLLNDDLELEEAAKAYVEALRVELLASSEWAEQVDRVLGFETHRKLNASVSDIPDVSWTTLCARIERWNTETFSSKILARQRLGQPLNLLDVDLAVHIPRTRFDEPVGTAIGSAEHRPVILSGPEGVGKSWVAAAAVHHLRGSGALLMFVPSRDIGPTAGLQDLLVDSLGHRVAGGTRDGWLDRLDGWFPSTGTEEHRNVVLVLDGLNETGFANWRELLLEALTPRWRNRLTLVLTTRPALAAEYRDFLRLYDTVPTIVEIDGFDDNELPAALAQVGRAELYGQLKGGDLERLLRTPRYFEVAVRLWERVASIEHVTVNRLILEDLRLGGHLSTERPNDEAWTALLSDMGQRLLDQSPSLNLTDARRVLSDSSLSVSNIDRGLEAIRSGRLFRRGGAGFVLEEEHASLAIGMSVVFGLIRTGATSAIEVEASIERMLPTLGAEPRADALAAATAIAFHWRFADDMGVIRAGLLRAWLQTQNQGREPPSEAQSFIESDVEAFVEAYEQEATSQSPDRRALHTLTEILTQVASRPDLKAVVLVRSARWAGFVGLREAFIGGEDKPERSARETRLVRTLGAMPHPGSQTILGAEITFIPGWDPEFLLTLAAALLDGEPLADRMDVIRTAAVAMAVGHSHAGTTKLRWAVRLNDVDPEETDAAIRAEARLILESSDALPTATRETAAAFLLNFIGDDRDLAWVGSLAALSDTQVGELYRDYLRDPTNSFFRLEPRHVDQVASDETNPVSTRLRRLSAFFADPSYRFPPDIIAATVEQALAAASDLAEKASSRSQSLSDIQFERVTPALARLAPAVLADLSRQLATHVVGREGQGLEMGVTELRRRLLTLDDAAFDQLTVLLEARLDLPPTSETIYVNRVLFDLLAVRTSSSDQVRRVTASGCSGIHLDTEPLLKAPSIEEIEAAIVAASGEADRLTNLFGFLSLTSFPMSPLIRRCLREGAGGAEPNSRALALAALSRHADAEAADSLLAADWRWTPGEDQENHSGSWILIEGGKHLGLDQLVHRVAPWLLPAAIVERGSSIDEVDIVAPILEAALFDRSSPPAVEAEVRLEVRDRAGRKSAPALNVSLNTPSDLSPETLTLAFDAEARHSALQAAASRVATMVADAQTLGAVFYYRRVRAEELLPFGSYLERWANRLLAEPDQLRRAKIYAANFVSAMCEALLALRPELGARLWSIAADGGEADAFHNARGGSLLLTGLFSAPAGPERDRLIDSMWATAGSDEGLFDLVFAAELVGAVDSLDRLIDRDQTSDRPYHRARALVGASFRSNAQVDLAARRESQMADLWLQRVRLSTAARAADNDSARHWFGRYVDATNDDEAYAAWELLLRVVDRRVYIWGRDVFSRLSPNPLRIAHWVLNAAELERAVKKNENKLDQQFLDEKIK